MKSIPEKIKENNLKVNELSNDNPATNNANKFLIKSFKKLIRPVDLNHHLYGEYLSYLESFSTPDRRPHLTPQDEHAPNISFLEFLNANIDAIRSNVSYDHGYKNFIAPDIVSNIVKIIFQALEVELGRIKDEIGKNTGAANKRRSRSLKRFKNIVNDYRLLLTASKQSIRSTMVERNEIVNHIGEPIKHIRNVEYVNYDYIKDLIAIEYFLNSDVEALVEIYDVLMSNLPTLNQYVEALNEAMSYA